MKNTTPKSQKCTTMNREAFWEVIAEAQNRKDSYDNNLLDEAMMEVLEEKYSNEALVQFHQLIPKLRGELPKETYDVAKQILPYDNLDGFPFHRFENWVIALGKQHYENTVENPAHLLTIKDPNLFVAGQALFEDLDYIAFGVYYDRQEKDSTLRGWDELLNIERRTPREQQLDNLRGKQDADLEIEQ